MRTFIFIRSFAQDREWLFWLLQSLDKFARGFDREITLEFPVSDSELIASALRPLKHFTLKNNPITPYCSTGYFCQQLSKLHADKAIGSESSDDLIFPLDSDCFLIKPITPEDFMCDGKPIVLMRRYAILPPPPEMPWKAITEKAVGFPVEMEFMARHPMIYPMWLYVEVRDHIEKTHGVSLEKYVSLQSRHEFSEFNLLGAIAYQFFREEFDFRDVSNVALPESPFHQSWSHSGISQEWRNEMQRILST